MVKYEYKTVMLKIKRNLGLFSSGVCNNSASLIENKLNELGREGWKLTGVFPVTNGGSPAQISHAAHYFVREIVAV